MENEVNMEHDKMDSWGAYLKKNSIMLLVNVATLIAIIVTLTMFIGRIDSRSIANEKKDVQQDITLEKYEMRLSTAEVETAAFRSAISEQYKNITEKLDELKKQIADHTK